MGDNNAYRRLFVHRSDVFAEQQSSSDYYPVQDPDQRPLVPETRPKDRHGKYLRPLTDEDIADHLAGRHSYGVYVIAPKQHVLYFSQGQPYGVPANSVRYVVFDLDTYDVAALDFLERAVERLIMVDGRAVRVGNAERKCLLLEDSGGKGYHIWLLLDAPVPAAKVRAWTKPIRDAYAEHAGLLMAPVKPWPALEVFPKQDAAPADGFGNLVKLPLGRHAVTHANSYFLRRAGWAMGVDEVVPFPSALIPEPAKEVGRTASDDEERGRTAFACVNELLEHGAGEGCRDKAMYFLARFWRSSGLTERQCEEVCIDANAGFDPPMGELQVRKCVRSAFAAEFARPKCGEDWHGSICPGSDRMRACPNYKGAPLGPATHYEDEDFSVSLEELARRQRSRGAVLPAHDEPRTP